MCVLEVQQLRHSTKRNCVLNTTGVLFCCDAKYNSILSNTSVISISRTPGLCYPCEKLYFYFYPNFIHQPIHTTQLNGQFHKRQVVLFPCYVSIHGNNNLPSFPRGLSAWPNLSKTHERGTQLIAVFPTVNDIPLELQTFFMFWLIHFKIL